MPGVFSERAVLFFFSFSLFSQVNSVGYSQQVNSYTVFHIKELSLGKNVTVGKYVLSYMGAGERIKIKGANPPQSLDIRLQWTGPGPSKNLEISGRWAGKERKLYIGIGKQKSMDTSPPLSLPQKPLFLEKKDNLFNQNSSEATDLVVIKGQNPESISLPLTGENHIYIFPDLESMGTHPEHIRIVVSSNQAYEISR